MRKYALLLTTAFTLACMSGWDEKDTAAPAPAAPTPAATAPAAAPAVDAPTAPAAIPAEYPYYEAEPYQRADLENMTLWELSIRRNTIFARVGNPFAKKWLNDFFSAQSWYEPRDRAYVELLPKQDLENAALIGQVESSLSREVLRGRLNDAISSRDFYKETLPPEIAIEIDLLSAALGEYAGDPNVPPGQRNPLEDPNELASELKPEQLTNLSRRDLRILRNTIFARHGRPFTSETMKSWFAQKAWYAEDPKYTDGALTEVDKANIALIVAEENRRGGMLSEDEHKKELEGLQAEIFSGA